MRALLAGLLLASVAQADPLSVEEQHLDLVLGPIAVGEVHPRFSVFADGQLATDRLGVAEVGGEISLETRACRWLVLGGSAAIAPDGPSLENWASVCLFAVPGVLGAWELHHHLELDAHPALSASPFVRRETYSHETFSMDVTMIDLDVDGKMRLQAFAAPTDLDFWWKGNDPAISVLVKTGVTVASLVWPDRRIDILPIRAAIGASQDASFAMTLGLVTFDGIPVGPLRIDVEPTWTFADAASAPTGRLAARLGAAELAWDRTLGPTPLGELVLDDRLTASFRRGPVQLRAFGARTQTVPGTAALTGGAGADLLVPVGHHFEVAATVEAARSFYARLDGAEPTPGFSARALVQLSARFASGN